jgi:hypothetical protein
VAAIAFWKQKIEQSTNKSELIIWGSSESQIDSRTDLASMRDVQQQYSEIALAHVASAFDGD